MNLLNPFFIVLLLMVVGIVGLAIVLISTLRNRAPNADKRLIELTGGTVASAEPADIKTRINEAVSKTDRGSNIARDLARADLKLTAGEFVILKVLAAVGV